MIDKNSKEYKSGVRAWFIWAIIIIILVVGGQIAFLVALSRL